MELVSSFKEAWYDAYGEPISDEDAQTYGRELLDTMGLLLKIRARTILEHGAERTRGESSVVERFES